MKPMRIAAINQQPAELHIVYEPRPDGPIIGFFKETPIAAAVLDYFGRRFTYDGVAPHRRDGSYDVKALRPGEWIVEPGLVYRLDAGRPARAA
ncbi:hypothetical protein [Hypericibacter adhaerens]|nr:hypothetical protein [Hypericibacter adhaerens]